MGKKKRLRSEARDRTKQILALADQGPKLYWYAKGCSGEYEFAGELPKRYVPVVAVSNNHLASKALCEFVCLTLAYLHRGQRYEPALTDTEALESIRPLRWYEFGVPTLTDRVCWICGCVSQVEIHISRWQCNGCHQIVI
jgi:hypothetical protein